MMTSTLEELCSEVDVSKLLAHLTEFSKRIKLSGTPEELESFRYLQRVLDDYGYRTALMQHDAYISLPGSARIDVEGEHPACITHSFSRDSSEDGAAGRLVYVGAGTDEEFARQDVSGQIAVIDGIATPATSLRASRAGAVGQLHVSSCFP